MALKLFAGLKGHVAYNTALFISARRGGFFTAIEAGVPEAILWMQSGHEPDVAARLYVQLRRPKLLFRTGEAFRLYRGSSAAMLPVLQPGPSGPAGGRAWLFGIVRCGSGRARPGLRPGRGPGAG